MTSPRSVAPGEKFEIQVRLPAGFPDEERASLQWALGAGWSDSTLRDLAYGYLPGLPELSAGGGMHRDSVLAPYARPGLYELRLVHGGQVLNALTVRVDKVRVPGALALSKVHRPGDRIEFTITIPANRYYYGQWHGPIVTIFPDSVGGRRIPTAEALNWWARGGPTCNGSTFIPCTSLIKEFASTPGANPYDGGVRIQPGTYTVDERFATERKLEYALFAPLEPGTYKVRFYDRTYTWRFEDYVDLYIDEQEIVVEPPGVSPSFLQFVSKCGATTNAAAALKTLTLGMPSFLAAVFDIVPGIEEPAERTATLERVDLGKVLRTPTKLTRIAPGVYCSGPIVPVAPAEPRRPAAGAV